MKKFLKKEKKSVEMQKIPKKRPKNGGSAENRNFRKVEMRAFFTCTHFRASAR